MHAISGKNNIYACVLNHEHIKPIIIGLASIVLPDA